MRKEWREGEGEREAWRLVAAGQSSRPVTPLLI